MVILCQVPQQVALHPFIFKTILQDMNLVTNEEDEASQCKCNSEGYLLARVRGNFC